MTLKDKLDQLFPEEWEDLDEEIMMQVIKEKLLERMQKQLEKEDDLFFSSSNEKVQHLTFLNGVPIYRHKQINDLYFGKYDFINGKPEKIKHVINVYYRPAGYYYQMKVAEVLVKESPEMAMEYIENRIEGVIKKIKANIDNYKIK